MPRHVFDPDGDVLLTLAIPGINTNNVSIELANDNIPEEFLVSSRHLMLASPVFKSMFQSRLAEGTALRSSGSATIPLFDDDSNALKVVMNIIHCQLKLVPQQLSLKQLAHLALLVDKYDFHSMVDYFAHKWIEELREEFPNCGYGDLHLWLCITWVFKLRVLFTQTTKLAIQYSKGELYEGIIAGYPVELPIPQAVFEKIKSERLRGIKSALLIIENAINKFQDNTVIHCSRLATQYSTMCFKKTPENMMQAMLCDSAILGSLIKGALEKQLYPLPIPPYSKLSYMETISEINSLAAIIPSHCQKLDNTKRQRYPYLPKQCHGLDQSIPSAIKELTDSIQGLDLQVFLPNAKLCEINSFEKQFMGS